MPEHLRSLLVVLAIATPLFALFRSAFCSAGWLGSEFDARRNLWFALTLTAFLSHNFWVFIIVAGLILHRAGAKEQNKVALVCFVLLVVPPIRAEITGLGLVNFFFQIDYLRLISLVVLIPACREAMKVAKVTVGIPRLADAFLFGYLTLIVVLSLIPGTITNSLRMAFYAIIDVLLPYVATSRLVKDGGSLRAIFLSYVLGALIFAALGVFEASKQWLLYAGLPDALGQYWGYGEYLFRGGILRASGTAGQAIPYGYSIAVGFLLMMSLRRFFQSRAIWLTGMGILTLGMIASLSRGPWVGAIVGTCVFVLSSFNSRTLIRVALFLVVALALYYLTPLGDGLRYYLPFSEDSLEQESYTYRALVFKNALVVIAQNPFFGAFDYFNAPEMQELIQGQGIIDIVNSYVAIALNSGIVGLALFVGIFASAVVGVFGRISRLSGYDLELYDIGRGLLAALAAILVTIATVSSISVIPIIYFLVVGLALAFVRISDGVIANSATLGAKSIHTIVTP
jgi:O-antigen ligase